jgi:hypothetical protein
MQEVREICDEMLAEPTPPMTSPDDLLRFARRSRARHRARLSIGFAAAATLLATAAVPLLATPSGQAARVVAADPSTSAPMPLPTLVAAVLPEGDIYKTTTDAGQLLLMRTLGDVPMPSGDLCQAEWPLRFKVNVEPGSCEVITIGEVRIRTGTYRVPQHGNTPAYDVGFAIRYLNSKAFIAVNVPKVAWEGGQPEPPSMSRRQLAEMLIPVSG